VKYFLLVAALGLVALAPACRLGSDSESTDDSVAEAVSGCHQVCPHCSNQPGTECPLSPCYLQCSDPSGHAICPDNQLCIQGYRWNPNSCKCQH
jgi:hypothetical protein